jgi:hypothetical protein
MSVARFIVGVGHFLFASTSEIAVRQSQLLSSGNRSSVPTVGLRASRIKRYLRSVIHLSGVLITSRQLSFVFTFIVFFQANAGLLLWSKPPGFLRNSNPLTCHERPSPSKWYRSRLVLKRCSLLISAGTQSLWLRFSWFYSTPPGQLRDNRPPPLPSKSLPIHRSVIILPLEVWATDNVAKLTAATNTSSH